MIRNLLNWFRRDKLEAGLDRELQYHVERRMNDLEKSLSSQSWFLKRLEA